MADQKLVSIVDRLVRLEEGRRAFVVDIKEVLHEARNEGYDPRALRIILKRRLEDADQTAKRKSTEELVELLEAELGTYAETPLGKAALRRMA